MGPGPPEQSRPELKLVHAKDPPQCPRCSAEGLLSASVPHGWLNNSGVRVAGTREVVLCPRCDADEPAASPLVLFFAVHGQVSEETAEEFATLVETWASQITTPELDQAALDREVQAWHRGELDKGEPSASGPYPTGDNLLDWSDRSADEGDGH